MNIKSPAEKEADGIIDSFVPAKKFVSILAILVLIVAIFIYIFFGLLLGIDVTSMVAICLVAFALCLFIRHMLSGI